MHQQLLCNMRNEKDCGRHETQQIYKGRRGTQILKQQSISNSIQNNNHLRKHPIMFFTKTFLLATLPFLTSAQTYKASFTEYGGCNVKTTACGFYTSPGYSAAISQNVFGVSSGAGPGCKTCWRITGDYDPVSNRPLSHPREIIVKVSKCVFPHPAFKPCKI